MNVEQFLAAMTGKIEALTEIIAVLAATSPEGSAAIALLKNRIDQLFQEDEPGSNQRYMTAGMREVLQKLEKVSALQQAAGHGKPSSIQ